MEEKNQKKVVPLILTVTLIVIIAVSVVAIYTNSKAQNATSSNNIPSKPQEAQITQSQEIYKDGAYSAVGEYTSPGGAESINVSLTLKDGTVTEATVESNATRPISKQMQTSFISGYKEQVVGKKIDELNLAKVAKSSLTPKGFNDAVAKIKSQAKS